MRGLTFSEPQSFLDNKSANDIYDLIKDKNIFEEVIDLLMVDKYIPEEDKEVLLELNIEEKREFIFNYVIGELGGSVSAVKILKKILELKPETPIVDKFKTCLMALNEYIKVGEQEVRDFGEVFTPLELVGEMLDTLPNEVWSNPNLKWLDPCAGMGNFPLVVIKRLMVGLKDWEKDSEKRYKHIIENMIYAGELQPKNAFMYLYMVDPIDTYEVNLYCGSFLEEEFDNHMKNVWNVDKFDIVLGNPPYNNSVDSLGRGTSTSKLPEEFMKKGVELLKDSMFLLYVLPTNNVVKFFFDYKIHAVSTNSFEHFGGNKLAVKTVYFLIEKTLNDKEEQKVKFIYKNGDGYNVIKRGENFGKTSYIESDSIKKKMFYSGDKFPFIKDKKIKSEGSYLYDKLDGKGIHLKLTNKDIIRNHTGKKFILNFDSRMRYYCDYEGDIKTSLPYIPCSTDIELDNYKTLVESSLVYVMSNNWGPKGFDVGRFFKNVSSIKIPKNFLIDNEYINKEYKLNQEEINFLDLQYSLNLIKK